MRFMLLGVFKKKEIRKLKVLLVFLIIVSCSKGDPHALIDNDLGDEFVDDFVATAGLPQRQGERPKTTPGIPHVQLGVNFVPEVNQELYRRVYSIPGIEQLPSVIGGWQGLSITNDITILVPDAILGGREFGHIHDDGSLHIFLAPSRAKEAVETWGIYHPFAIGKTGALSGFVMLYTPQSIEELNITFQLIIEAYNFITKQNIKATDYQ
jgi:phospholipase/carboxylesterase